MFNQLVQYLIDVYTALTGTLKTQNQGYTYTVINTKTTTAIPCKNFHGYFVSALGSAFTVNFEDGGTEMSAAFVVAGALGAMNIYDIAITSGTLNVITGGTTAGTITVLTS